MLLNPVVPFSPVTVKDTAIAISDWFVVMAISDICELVTFPVIAKFIIEPLFAVPATVVVEEGKGVAIGVSVGVVVLERVGIGVGFRKGFVV